MLANSIRDISLYSLYIILGSILTPAFIYTANRIEFNKNEVSHFVITKETDRALATVEIKKNPRNLRELTSTNSPTNVFVQIQLHQENINIQVGNRFAPQFTYNIPLNIMAHSSPPMTGGHNFFINKAYFMDSSLKQYWISIGPRYLALGAGSSCWEQIGFILELPAEAQALDLIERSGGSGTIRLEKVTATMPPLPSLTEMQAQAHKQNYTPELSAFSQEEIKKLFSNQPGWTSPYWKTDWKLTEKNNGSIIFTTSSKQDITLCFANTTSPTGPFYEIIWNSENTGKGVIKRGGAIVAQTGSNTSHVHSISPQYANVTATIQDYYWATYNKGIIALGHGSEPGKNIALVYKDQTPLSDIEYYGFKARMPGVNFISYRAIESKPTGTDQSLTLSNYFIVNESVSSYLLPQFSEDYLKNNRSERLFERWIEDWRLPENDKGGVIFKAEAGGSNHSEPNDTSFLLVGLSDTLTNKQGVYSICIHKWNTYAAIGPYLYTMWANDDENYRKNQPKKGLGYLNSLYSKAHSEEHYYWIAYENGIIAWGHGREIGKQVGGTFHAYSIKEVTTNIRYFSFTTFGNSILRFSEITPVALPEGVSFFDPQYASLYILNTHSKKTFEEWRTPWKLQAPDKGGITFSARGIHNTPIKEIKVGFSPILKPEVPSYVVTFHDQSPTIQLKGGAPLPLRAEDPNLIYINTAYTKTHGAVEGKYWAAYSQGVIAWGHGEEAGKQIGAIYKVPEIVPNLLYFSFTGFTEDSIYFSTIMPTTTPLSFSKEALFSDNTYTLHKPAPSTLSLWPENLHFSTPGKGFISFTNAGGRDMTVCLSSLALEQTIAPSQNTQVGEENTVLQKPIVPYMVTIGAGENKSINIKKNGSFLFDSGQVNPQDPQLIYYNPEYASIDPENTYWVGVLNNTIIVGQGLVIGKKVALIYRDIGNTLSSIEYVSFYTNTSESLSFSNCMIQENNTLSYDVVAGGGRYQDWKNEWSFTTPGVGSFSFEIINTTTSPRNVFIGLASQEQGLTSEGLYDIVIAEQSNEIQIRKQGSVATTFKINNASSSTSSPLSDTYWVLVAGKTVAIGTGSTVGVNALGTWSDTQLANITHFSFSNLQENTTFTSIINQQTEDPRTYTATSQQYLFTHWNPAWRLHMVDEGIIQFKAHQTDTSNTDKSIIIGLDSTLNKSSATYEIIINGWHNSKSVIRKNATTVTEKSTSSAPSSAQENETHYWIHYKNGYIAVGQSTVPGENMFMQWKDPHVTPHILHFSLSSNTNTVIYSDIISINAQEFNMEAAMTKEYDGRGATTFPVDETWKFKENDKGTLIFTVTAAQEFAVGLFSHSTQQSLQVNNIPYRITFGEWGNTSMGIYKNGTGINFTREKVALNNQPETFWINFNKGDIKVGRGIKPGENILLQWKDKQALVGINGFTFSPGASYSALESKVLSDPTMFYREKNISTYIVNPQWNLPKKNTGLITFQAKASQNIHIVFLSPTEQKEVEPTSAAYRIILGGWGNTGSGIYKLSEGVAHESKGIINDGQFHDYWALYEEGKISAGTGTVPGENILVEWYDEASSSLPITHFSLSNQVEFVNIAASLPSQSLSLIEKEIGTILTRKYENTTQLIDTLLTETESLIVGKRRKTQNFSSQDLTDFVTLLTELTTYQALYTPQQKKKLSDILNLTYYDTDSFYGADDKKAALIVSLYERVESAREKPEEEDTLQQTMIQRMYSLSQTLSTETPPSLNYSFTLFFTALESLSKKISTLSPQILEQLSAIEEKLKTLTIEITEYRTIYEKAAEVINQQESALEEKRKSLMHNVLQALKTESLLPTLITKLQDLLIQSDSRALTAEEQDVNFYLQALEQVVHLSPLLTNEEKTKLTSLLTTATYSSIMASKKSVIETLATSVRQQTHSSFTLSFIENEYKNLISQTSIEVNDARKTRFISILQGIQSGKVSLSEGTNSDLATTVLSPAIAHEIFTESEKETLSSIKQELLLTEQTLHSSASYQLKQIAETQDPLLEYTKSLQALLLKKDQNLVTFTPTDIETFYLHLMYLADIAAFATTEERELIESLFTYCAYHADFTTKRDDINQLRFLISQASTIDISFLTKEVTFLDNLPASPENKRKKRFIILLSKIAGLPEKAEKGTPTGESSLPLTENGNSVFIPNDVITSLLEKSFITPEEKVMLEHIQATITEQIAAKEASEKTYQYNLSLEYTQSRTAGERVSTLSDLIIKKRQTIITFVDADYEDFVLKLESIVNDRELLSAKDLTSLQATLNFTQYTPGFSEKTELIQKINSLQQILTQPLPAIEERIDKYIAKANEVITKQETISTTERFYFFTYLSSLQDGSLFTSPSLTTKVEEQLLKVLETNLVLQPEETTIITNLRAIINQKQQVYNSLSYTLDNRTRTIEQAAPAQWLEASISSLITVGNTIINGVVNPTPEEYEKYLQEITTLVNKRDAFSAEQLTRFEAHLTELEKSENLQSYKARLAENKSTLKQPYAFDARVALYQNLASQLSANTTLENPQRYELVDRLKTIMQAPGQKTLEKLESLTTVANTIIYGLYTAAHKEEAQKLITEIEKQKTIQLNRTSGTGGITISGNTSTTPPSIVGSTLTRRKPVSRRSVYKR